ncbi:MAG: methyltransferase, TIGR04325 family [Candidatus Eremiobacteraeota bacterium]|nr:methyltransferase, TIGR04325 family [Candidatus Eremiobacteraeota bacterium]
MTGAVRLARHAGRIPLLRHVASHAYGRYFDRAGGRVRMFHGIYPDFPNARAHVPPRRLVGYDNEPSASRVLDEWLQIWPYDYPVLYWLTRLLPECRSVFDWGGNVGLKYFSYRRYLEIPPTTAWWVSDVPAVVRLGRAVASREGNPRSLQFTTGLEALETADLLFASGSIQFIENPFAALAAHRDLPRHAIFSKVPVTDRPAAVTLHNMGSAVCPYHLFNRETLLRNLEGLGYRLVDAWTSPDCSCEIPFHADYTIPAYSGLYFRRQDACI